MIDFDAWMKLYQDNPTEFEKQRSEFLNQQILLVPIKHRDSLRLTQLECDTIRMMYPPMEATIKISDMMVEKLQELKTNLVKFTDTLNTDQST